LINREKQLVDFNTAKDNYREVIERSIGFAGRGLDYYTKAKADAFKRAVSTNFAHLRKPKLLDVGCGHGLIHPYLASSFAIVGTDVANEVLTLAARQNPGVSYVPYGGTKLPFADASFDLALAICVMHHVPPAEWLNFLGEMKRVVKPEGGIFVFEHNPFNPFTRYVVSHNDLDRGVTLLSGGRLRKLMREAGLRAPLTENILFTPFSQRLFTQLDKVLKWCPIGAQYFTFART
jgi:SAM-dependent methyltransferase